MSPLDLPKRLNLIFGCGYLGRRVARRWLAAGHRVAAFTRRNGETLISLGITPVLADILNLKDFGKMPAVSTVLYAVGFDRSAGKSMREVYVDGLGHALDTLSACERFIYVSSTSVYAQTDGGWVTEDSATEPTQESGKVVLEAERLLHSRLPNAIILRFGGIYGPDRLLRRRHQLLAKEPFTGDVDRWLNLIHADDGADAILTAESRGTPCETYNIADDEPVTRRAFYAKLAELLEAPPPRFDPSPEPGSTNRRISNAKAKATLGWQPRFPSYREGLVHAVAETTTW